MVSLKSVALGAAFIGSAATMTLTATSAQAASISGSVVGYGVSQVTGDITVSFGVGIFQGASAEGEFSDLSGSTTIANLVLTNGPGARASGTYNYSAITPFITFNSNGSTFNLNGGSAEVEFFGNQVNIDLTPITGDLINPAPGSSFRASLFGSLSLSDSRVDSPALGSFQYDLQRNAGTPANPTAVPEPLTILGAGTAVAFGGIFKGKLGKKDKKGSTKA